MEFKKELLLYRIIDDYHELFYSDKLTEENMLNDGQLIRLNKLILPSGSEELNFWGWQFKKDNKTYILSVYDDCDNEISLKDIFPIKIKSCRKVAYQKEVFYEITNYASVKFKPIQHFSMKELVNILTKLNHSNPTHYKLNIMTDLCSMFDNFVSRKSTPPGFGKDSSTQVFNSLFGGFHSITTPSTSKLQFEFSVCKKVVLNEIGSWRKDCIELAEPILLNSSDGKPTVRKNTRGGFGVGETINIKNLAIDIFYNDIDCYDNTKKYLDFKFNSAIPDRFVPFRFYGRIVEDFSKYATLNTKKVAKENIDTYKKLIETLEFYRLNYFSLLHNYKRNKLDFVNMKKRPRWLTHLNKLLNVIDIYSETQEEFDNCCLEISKAITDYGEMLLYPKMLVVYYSKLKIPKTEMDKFSETKIRDVLHYLKSDIEKYKEGSPLRKGIQRKIDYTLSIIEANTFIEKNKLIDCYVEPKDDKQQSVDDIQVEW